MQGGAGGGATMPAEYCGRQSFYVRSAPPADSFIMDAFFSFFAATFLSLLTRNKRERNAAKD